MAHNASYLVIYSWDKQVPSNERVHVLMASLLKLEMAHPSLEVGLIVDSSSF